MLSREEKIAYVTGKGMWHTNDLNGKMPSIHMSDGPHGMRTQDEGKMFNNDSKIATCFPTASAIACSFDRDLVCRMAEAIAEEAKDLGVSVVLGPGVNMKRSPLCGRNFEYYSEDPYLAGELGASYIQAMQSQGIGTSLKHFAVNSQETYRMTMSAEVDERTLREIYLAAFEKCVKKAKPATIMASYNRVNGLHSCQNTHLLQDILRGDWGYEGCVISDWGACVDLPACIEAGMDLEMPDSFGNHKEEMIEALESGALSQKALERAVQNISNLVQSYPPRRTFGETKSHYDLAKEMSLESAVLLKNDGVLPVTKETKLLVVGALAEDMRIQGGGSSHIHTRPLKNILQVLQEQRIDYRFAKGYDEDNTVPSRDLEQKALAMVEQAKAEDRVILFCGGLTDYTEGEGYDRMTLKMPDNQRILFDKIVDIYPKVIFLSFGGAPYDMSVADRSKAVLQMYLGGEGVAEAAVDLLFGEANPGGKLAETWPMRIEDTPSFGNFGKEASNPQSIAYTERFYIGYRHYDAKNIKVRFPFGYGLSYTSFSYESLRINPTGDRQYEVCVLVTNTGKRAGKEIVQLYVENPQTGFPRAIKELKGFEKVSLQPGETKEILMYLTERDFSVFDVAKNDFVCVAGEYGICVGASADDIRLREKISVDGVILEPESEEISWERMDTQRTYSMKNSIRQLRDTSFEAKAFYHMLCILGRIITLGKKREDPEVMMMMEGILDGNLASVVNQSGGILRWNHAKRIVKKANRNIRRGKE